MCLNIFPGALEDAALKLLDCIGMSIKTPKLQILGEIYLLPRYIIAIFLCRIDGYNSFIMDYECCGLTA